MNVFEKLKTVPHLKLPIAFGVETLLSEVQAMPELISYELPGENRPEFERERYRQWKGRGLIDFEPDSTKGMLDARTYQGQPPPLNVQWKDGKRVVFETELARAMPACMTAIYELFDDPERTRITSMAAGGGLNWHSHCQFKTGNYRPHDNYNLAIVHVPIITNPAVKFGVTKFHHDEFGYNPVWQHYAPGEVWLLNAWHEHNVKNEGDEDRIHIMIYGSLNDPKLMPLIEDALDEYDGPYIE